MQKKISEIVKMTTGKLLSGNENDVITGISTDSRNITKGDLFIALQGENFDGHDYVASALENGAAAVLVQKIDLPGVNDSGIPCIVVENTLEALGQIAHSYRKQFTIPVIAITGSNGKTTTKDMVAAVLGRKFNVLKTIGNYNNEIGLPLTLLNLQETSEVAVLEMAMRGKGQISYLCEIAEPNIGIITNIAPVHYELLGSMENIAKAKGELIENLPEDGLAILNGDDKWCLEIIANYSGKLFTYGFRPENDFRAENIVQENFGTSFELLYLGQSIDINLPLPGKHNVLNSLAAAAVGISFGLSLEEIQTALNSVEISSMRLEMLQGPCGSTFINDSYNANPVSMKASIDVLKKMKNGRKIAVLGDMLELGELAIQGHQEVGRAVYEKRIDLLITVGNLAQEIARGAASAGMSSENIFCFANTNDAAKFLEQILEKDDKVLLKGSRSMKMEKILKCLN